MCIRDRPEPIESTTEVQDEESQIASDEGQNDDQEVIAADTQVAEVAADEVLPDESIDTIAEDDVVEDQLVASPEEELIVESDADDEKITETLDPHVLEPQELVAVSDLANEKTDLEIETEATDVEIEAEVVSTDELTVSNEDSITLDKDPVSYTHLTLPTTPYV